MCCWQRVAKQCVLAIGNFSLLKELTGQQHSYWLEKARRNTNSLRLYKYFIPISASYKNMEGLSFLSPIRLADIAD